MKKRASNFIFNYQIGELLTFVMYKLSFVHRDIVEFEKFGITADDLAGVKTMASEFEKLGTDEEFLGS